MSFSPVRDEQEDVIKSGALRVTWISGTIGGIGAILTVFNEEFIHVFGEHASDGIKASVLIAIIAAWAAIAVADIISRSITTSAGLKTPSEAIAAPKGLKVTLTDGQDSDGWSVAAIKGSNGNGGEAAEFLVVKAGQQPKWVEQDDVVTA